jgi:hypothetical protein
MPIRSSQYGSEWLVREDWKYYASPLGLQSIVKTTIAFRLITHRQVLRPEIQPWMC